MFSRDVAEGTFIPFDLSGRDLAMSLTKGDLEGLKQFEAASEPVVEANVPERITWKETRRSFVVRPGTGELTPRQDRHNRGQRKVATQRKAERLLQRYSPTWQRKFSSLNERHDAIEPVWELLIVRTEIPEQDSQRATFQVGEILGYN